MSSPDRVRVGVIGAGGYACLVHIPTLCKIERAEVTAICRRDPVRLGMVQEAFGIAHAFTDWQQMLDEAVLDAVVVSTPHHLHAIPTIAALERGLHVLVEKPMALTSEEGGAMVQAAEKAKRVLMVGCPMRLKGKWQTVKSLITDGAIGQLRQINAAHCFYRRWFWQTDQVPADIGSLIRQLTPLPEEFVADWGRTWHGKPAEMGGGAFIDLGAHHVDLLLWLAGAPAKEVVAFTEQAGLPVDCFVSAQARLTNGTLLTITTADAFPQDLLAGQQQLMIVGERGAITDDPEGNLWIYRNGSREQIAVTRPNIAETEAFIQTILDGTENLVPAQEGAQVVNFITAMYRSAAEQTIVHL